MATESLFDVLVRVRIALMALGPPAPAVLLPGDPEPVPEPAEVIILQPVADTRLPSYGTEASTKRVQVTCYAPTVKRALALDSAARAALAAAGLRWIASRPAPDPEAVGMLPEYRR